MRVYSQQSPRFYTVSVTAKTYDDENTGIAVDFNQMACFKAVGTVLHEAGVCRL